MCWSHSNPSWLAFVFIFVYLFWDRVSLCNPCLTGTHYVDRVGLNFLKDPPASALQRHIALKQTSSNTFLKIYFKLQASLFVYVHICGGPPEDQKKVSDPLKLELRVFMILPVWDLGNELRSFARRVSILSCRAISLSLCWPSVTMAVNHSYPTTEH